jgi:hypothetical protein
MFIINNINYEKPLLDNSNILKQLPEKILLIFERIKKNEIVS